MRCMHLCACACMGIEIVTKPDFQDILIIDDLYCISDGHVRVPKALLLS